jgi:hypothetical protein
VRRHFGPSCEKIVIDAKHFFERRHGLIVSTEKA